MTVQWWTSIFPGAPEARRDEIDAVLLVLQERILSTANDHRQHFYGEEPCRYFFSKQGQSWRSQCARAALEDRGEELEEEELLPE